jgi:2-polyprenyl-3-methyl-5-hydroxy-6-metoxy-1,4-benzoquinol methylase
MNRKPLKEIDGIKIFSDSDFYWGIVPRKEMEAYNELAKKIGFEAARKSFAFSNRFDYANSYRRSDFHFLIPCKKDSVVLDIGSGFGNVTIPIASYHSKVVAVDGSLPLLQYSKLRAESEGIKNIDFIQVNSFDKCDLPFEPKSFDVIILNGVLEWVGSEDIKSNPRTIQLAFLRQIRTLLKDDGALFIGIENRLFPGWLKRDPHSKLPLTSILPRKIANCYAKFKGFKNGYGTYIYSRGGYKRLLKESGFNSSNFYYPFTSYREPNYIYSDNRKAYKYFMAKYSNSVFTSKWRAFLKLMRFLGLEKQFISSYYIIAGDIKSHPPFLNSLVDSTVDKELINLGNFIKVPSEGDFATFTLVNSDEKLSDREFHVPRLKR